MLRDCFFETVECYRSFLPLHELHYVNTVSARYPKSPASFITYLKNKQVRFLKQMSEFSKKEFQLISLFFTSMYVWHYISVYRTQWEGTTCLIKAEHNTWNNLEQPSSSLALACVCHTTSRLSRSQQYADWLSLSPSFSWLSDFFFTSHTLR